jgi:uncharacterized protein (TIGR00369 family)
MPDHAPLPPDTFDRMSGLEALQAMMRGELPAAPIAKVLNYWLAEVGDGFAAFEGEATAEFLNPGGTTHGGWAATLLDSALGCAVHTTLVPGERYTTIEMKMNLTRPILPGKTGKLRCEGRIVHRGRTTAITEARLIDGDGRLYAHATETCMIFPKPGK